MHLDKVMCDSLFARRNVYGVILMPDNYGVDFFFKAKGGSRCIHRISGRQLQRDLALTVCTQKARRTWSLECSPRSQQNHRSVLSQGIFLLTNILVCPRESVSRGSLVNIGSTLNSEVQSDSVGRTNRPKALGVTWDLTCNWTA